MPSSISLGTASQPPQDVEHDPGKHWRTNHNKAEDKTINLEKVR